MVITRISLLDSNNRKNMKERRFNIVRVKLYKLAVWYIGRCNDKWQKSKQKQLESLYRLTYRSPDNKYLLLYGADAEWRKFSRYDVLDNAIQKLGKFEDIGKVEEFRRLQAKEEIEIKDSDSQQVTTER